jgi:hypothetical protein
MSRAVPVLPLCAFMACYRVNFTLHLFALLCFIGKTSNVWKAFDWLNPSSDRLFSVTVLGMWGNLLNS